MYLVHTPGRVQSDKQAVGNHSCWARTEGWALLRQSFFIAGVGKALSIWNEVQGSEGKMPPPLLSGTLGGRSLPVGAAHQRHPPTHWPPQGWASVTSVSAPGPDSLGSKLLPLLSGQGQRIRTVSWGNSHSPFWGTGGRGRSLLPLLGCGVVWGLVLGRAALLTLSTS